MGQDPSRALWSCALNCLLNRAVQGSAIVRVQTAGEVAELSMEAYWQEFYARVLLEQIGTDPAPLDQAAAGTSQLLEAPDRAPWLTSTPRLVIEEAIEIAQRARALLTQPSADLDPSAFMAGRLEAEHPSLTTE